MRNGKLTGLFVVAAILALAIPASAENLISNPDFETGDLDGWVAAGEGTLATITVAAGNGPSDAGSYNAFLDNQAQALGLTLKYTTPSGYATPGAATYSFDLKLDQADVGGVLFVQIFAEQTGVGIVGGSGLMGPFWAWEWTTYSGSFSAPEGTDFMTIQFTATTGATEGSNCLAHVDNVVLDQGTVSAEDLTWSELKALYR